MTAVRWIWVTAFGGLAFRLWAVLDYRETCDETSTSCYQVAGDALYHHTQADLIADGHWYQNGLEYTFNDGLLIDSAGDPPAYALYLAGWSSVGLDSVTAHRVVSTLCGFALIVLIGLLARKLGGDRAGVIAAVIAAVHPLMWINDIMLLSEGLYQPIVVVVLWAAYAWVDHPDRTRVALLGAAIAVAALTRAEAIALFGFLVVPLVWWARSLATRERLIQIGACWAVGLVVLAPWVGWNMVRFENPATLSAVTGTVLMAGSCDSAWSGEKMGFWDDCFTERGLWEEYEAEFPGVTLTGEDRVVYDETARDAFNREKAFEYLTDNWTEYPVVAAARVGRSLELFRAGHSLRMNYQLEGRWEEPSTIGLGVYYALVPFTLIGGFVMWRRRIRLVPMVSMWLMVAFASATTFGLTRYRVPVDIAMIIMSAIAASWLWDRLREQPRAPDADTEPEPVGAGADT